MLRYLLATSLLVLAVGCGTDPYDESRVPEDAADTSDPTSVQMDMGVMSEAGTPRGAQPGPPAQ